jgi:cell division protein FtsN
MPRDYKHRAHRRKKKHSASPWLGVVTGLLIGLFVAFLVYIKMQANDSTTQVVVKESLPAQSPQEDMRDVRKEKKATITPPEPRFDFYNLLPEMEVIVPESEIKKPRVKPATPDSSTASAPAKTIVGTYYLQIGSFKNAEQADNLKAKLAFSGFETVIHKATLEISGKSETFHRVRVGPFNNLDAANRSREKLIASGIDSKVVEIKG